jgi:hypothetical protein
VAPGTSIEVKEYSVAKAALGKKTKGTVRITARDITQILQGLLFMWHLFEFGIILCGLKSKQFTYQMDEIIITVYFCRLFLKEPSCSEALKVEKLLTEVLNFLLKNDRSWGI